MISTLPTDTVLRFPDHSQGWHLFASVTALQGGPVSRDVFGQRVVVWRAGPGVPWMAVDARCWHLGADLGSGDVADGCLRCPFHHWRYDANGGCDMRPDARQRVYGVAERGGFVFVRPTVRPPVPPPFFDDVDPARLVAAPPFELTVECPWYLVGANGFDVQHFRCAHDRLLDREPRIELPSPQARRITAHFSVVGNSWRDRLTRLMVGPNVEMTVTDWCGALVFVRARFARTVTYGMVSIRSLAESRTLVHVTVFAERGRPCRGLDRLSARIKANFIRNFLQPDIQSLAGTRLCLDRLIPADREMGDYLRWLAVASQAGVAQ